MPTQIKKPFQIQQSQWLRYLDCDLYTENNKIYSLLPPGVFVFHKHMFYFEKWNYFCKKKNHIYDPKMQITIIICSDNVFTIVVWDFITIARKLQKLQLITLILYSIFHPEYPLLLSRFCLIYPNEKSVKSHKLWLLHSWGFTPNRFNPSIVTTRKVIWCKYYHFFDQLSSL